MQKITALLSLIFILAGCGTPATVKPIATHPAPTKTPSPHPATSTPTLSPTPVNTFTPTPRPVITLDPIFLQELNGEYWGIKIKSKVITDRSANNEAGKVTLSGPTANQALAEFWVRAAYKVWLVKGGVDGTGPASGVNRGLENFMRSWALAQKTGARQDWEKVQLTLWADDLGIQEYQPIPLIFWLGYQSGETPPEGVVAVNELDIAIVNPGSPNVTPWGVYGAGIGTNYLQNSLIMYICKFDKTYDKRTETEISGLVSMIPKWWLGYDGRPFVTLNASYATDLVYILKRGGFVVTPP